MGEVGDFFAKNLPFLPHTPSYLQKTIKRIFSEILFCRSKAVL
jgi:hypothetical protein